MKNVVQTGTAKEKKKKSTAQISPYGIVIG